MNFLEPLKRAAEVDAAGQDRPARSKAGRKPRKHLNLRERLTVIREFDSKYRTVSELAERYDVTAETIRRMTRPGPFRDEVLLKCRLKGLLGPSTAPQDQPDVMPAPTAPRTLPDLPEKPAPDRPERPDLTLNEVTRQRDSEAARLHAIIIEQAQEISELRGRLRAAGAAL